MWNYVNKSPIRGNNKPFWKYIKVYNIRVAAIKNNCILHRNSKTKAELLHHKFMLFFSMNDNMDHLPTMSHAKLPNIENITICIE